MKFLKALVFLVLSVASISANAQRFEGLIVYRIESGAGVIQQKSWVKGDSVVIEAQAPMPPRSFANFATGEYTVYQGEQSQLQKLVDFDPAAPKTNNLQPQPGRKTISNREAQLYTFDVPTSDQKMMTASFWLTSDYPKSIQKAIARNLLIGTAEDKLFRDVAAEIDQMGLAPVSITISLNGKEAMSMQVVAATEQPIPLQKFDSAKKFE